MEIAVCTNVMWRITLFLQVILGAREAEMQFLRQEAHSLKEELKIARMVVLFLFLVKCIVRTTEFLIFHKNCTHLSLKELIVAEICGYLLIYAKFICHTDYKTVF